MLEYAAVFDRCSSQTNVEAESVDGFQYTYFQPSMKRLFRVSGNNGIIRNYDVCYSDNSCDYTLVEDDGFKMYLHDRS